MNCDIPHAGTLGATVHWNIICTIHFYYTFFFKTVLQFVNPISYSFLGCDRSQVFMVFLYVLVTLWLNFCRSYIPSTHGTNRSMTLFHHRWNGMQIYHGERSFYTGCNRRKGPDFGRVFLMLNYTEKLQNTYIQSWTVWEIMAFENCELPSGPRTIAVTWDSYLLVGLRVTSPLNIPVWCIVLRTVSISMTRMWGTLQLQLMALCHSQVTLMKSTDINITETTYSCQFQYEFGNQ